MTNDSIGEKVYSFNGQIISDNLKEDCYIKIGNKAIVLITANNKLIKNYKDIEELKVKKRIEKRKNFFSPKIYIMFYLLLMMKVCLK